MTWDRVITVLLVICAVVTTGTVLRREFVSHKVSDQSEPFAGEPRFHDDWRSFMGSGTLMGPANARVQILEFADFECPFCERMHSLLKRLRKRFPADVSVTFAHFPLPQHRFAEIAARAADCADKQGRFEEMHDILFENQRNLGIRAWDEMAIEAGVVDGVEFGRCLRKSSQSEAIVVGQQLAERLNIRGTPTLIVNGWQLTTVPDGAALESMVERVLQGHQPLSE